MTYLEIGFWMMSVGSAGYYLMLFLLIKFAFKEAHPARTAFKFFLLTVIIALALLFATILIA